MSLRLIQFFRDHIEPDIDGATFSLDVDALNAVMGVDHVALLTIYESLLNFPEQCKFTVAWKSHFPE